MNYHILPVNILVYFTQINNVVVEHRGNLKNIRIELSFERLLPPIYNIVNLMEIP